MIDMKSNQGMDNVDLTCDAGITATEVIKVSKRSQKNQ